MRIIIVGAGKLGYTIAERLSQEEYDVVVVDNNAARLQNIQDSLDVLTVTANGSSPITMNNDDIRDADVLIAVTATDEVNMVSCILAKKHGIKRTIARIRDMQFISEAKEYLKSNFDIDLMLNPELIMAMEINRILMVPAALNIEDFADGQVRLFETKVKKDSSLSNIKLKDLDMPKTIIAAMIFRGQRMIIPHGDDSLQPNDNAYFIGLTKDINSFSKNLVERNNSKLEKVTV
ncbi:MAG: NAD-binding protein, partial [Anaerovibrio sp.]|uniref:NAD-binding protein n=1 Tax=Anaerovibrio sp. TaxID=1872532 RepID=UPI0025EC4C8E